MIKLVRDVRDCYLFSGLRFALKSSQVRLCSRQDKTDFRHLSLLAFALFLLAGGLFLGGGYHAGFQSLNQFTPLMPSHFWSMLTFLGDTTVALSLMLFFARRNPAILGIILLAAIYGTLISHGMKAGFGQARPAGIFPDDAFNLVGQAFKRNSFPSGHSLAIFTLVTLLYYFTRQRTTRLLLLTFGTSVAVSRVMVGAHWPVDVLVGSGLGILTTLAAIYTAKHWQFVFNIVLHWCVLSLLITAAVMLYHHTGGYPQAKWLGAIIASTSLAYCLLSYLFIPVAHTDRLEQQESVG